MHQTKGKGKGGHKGGKGSRDNHKGGYGSWDRPGGNTRWSQENWTATPWWSWDYEPWAEEWAGWADE